jgi:hypothetical protein
MWITVAGTVQAGSTWTQLSRSLPPGRWPMLQKIRNYLQQRDDVVTGVHESAFGRYCCKKILVLEQRTFFPTQVRVENIDS